MVYVFINNMVYVFINNMVYVFFKSSPGNKKHLILNKAVLSRLIDSIYYTCQYILVYSALFCDKNGGAWGNVA